MDRTSEFMRKRSSFSSTILALSFCLASRNTWERSISGISKMLIFLCFLALSFMGMHLKKNVVNLNISFSLKLDTYRETEYFTLKSFFNFYKYY